MDAEEIKPRHKSEQKVDRHGIARYSETLMMVGVVSVPARRRPANRGGNAEGAPFRPHGRKGVFICESHELEARDDITQTL